MYFFNPFHDTSCVKIKQTDFSVSHPSAYDLFFAAMSALLRPLPFSVTAGLSGPGCHGAQVKAATGGLPEAGSDRIHS
jgi:hypothetical protein